MTLPLLYISTRVEELDISTIHVKAEQEILAIQSRSIVYKTSVLNKRMFNVDIDSLSKAKRKLVIDSVFASKKLVSITPDSAKKELDKLDKLRNDHLILLVKLGEKGEVMQAHFKTIRFYLWYALFYSVVGFVMATLGFGLWYKKEYPEGITISFRKAKAVASQASTNADDATAPIEPNP